MYLNTNLCVFLWRKLFCRLLYVVLWVGVSPHRLSMFTLLYLLSIFLFSMWLHSHVHNTLSVQPLTLLQITTPQQNPHPLDLTILLPSLLQCSLNLSCNMFCTEILLIGFLALWEDTFLGWNISYLFLYCDKRLEKSSL